MSGTYLERSNSRQYNWIEVARTQDAELRTEEQGFTVRHFGDFYGSSNE